MSGEQNNGNAGAVLFAVVRREPGGGNLVRDAVVSFESPVAADLFAVEAGWSDYQVCELRFLVDELPSPARAARNGADRMASVASDGETWTVFVSPGTDAVDLMFAAAQVPARCTFSEAYGDVEIMLVYRPAAGGRSLNTILDTARVGLGTDGQPAGARFMTVGEIAAYRAGRAEAFDALRRAAAGTPNEANPLPPAPLSD
jgi:uncharacterized repeat protein (TIGR03917 family)